MVKWLFRMPVTGNFRSEAEALAHGAVWGLIAAALFTVAVALLTGGAEGAQDVVPRGSGQCPSGSSVSGAYCVLPPAARRCVPKRGQCPGGWRQSGGFCCP